MLQPHLWIHAPARHSNTSPPQISNIEYSNNKIQISTWNIASLNTFLSCLHALVNQTKLAILTKQETKLTAKKFLKYIQNLYSKYKIILNNLNTSTRHTIIPGIPYEPRGGLLALIHNKYAHPNNINKIQTPTKISPYLQIIRLQNKKEKRKRRRRRTPTLFSSVQNKPLSPHTILHLYIPSHDNDTHLIPIIKTTIIPTHLPTPK